MTHVTCRLTTKNWDQLRNPTLSNRVWVKEFRPAFSCTASSTDLTATKLFSSNVTDGFSRTVLMHTHQRPQLVEEQHWTLHSTGILASKFARFVSDGKHLEHYGCSCLCQPRAADTDGTQISSSEILEINFLNHSAKFHRFYA